MCGCRYGTEPFRKFWMAVTCSPGADLVRAIQPIPEGLNMDFLRASSYTGAATTGQDAVVMGLVSKIPIEGRHILLVEDIIDTGKTLQVSDMHVVLQHGNINDAASVSMHLLFFCSWSWAAHA